MFFFFFFFFFLFFFSIIFFSNCSWVGWKLPSWSDKIYARVTSSLKSGQYDLIISALCIDLGVQQRNVQLLKKIIEKNNNEKKKKKAKNQGGKVV